MRDYSNIPLADFGEEDQENEFAAQPVIFGSKDINPDTRAKAIDIQQTNQLPVEVIESDLQKYEKDRDFNSIDLSAHKDSPVTMRGLSDPVTSPLYMDDLENLSLWEKTIGGIGAAWEAGRRNVNLKDINARKFMGIATEQDHADEKELERQAKRYKSGGGFDNFFAQIPAQVAEMAPLYLNALAESYDEAAVGGAAGITALGPAGAGAGLAIGVGYGTIIEMGKTEASLAYAELIKMKDTAGKPIDENAARGAAAVVGVLNGAIELAGAKVAMKLVGFNPVGELASKFSRESLKKLMKIPAVSNTFAKLGKLLVGGSAIGGAEEALQEGVNLLIGEPLAAQFNSALAQVVMTPQEQVGEQIAGAARAGAQVGIAFEGPKAAMIAYADKATQNSLTRNAEMVNNLAGLMENSKTHQRLPQKLREHISNIKEEYGATTDVTVPFEVMSTYFQEAGITNDQIEKEMPQVAAALREAEQGQTDVAIPVEDFTEFFARSENFQQHIPDVRMHPELPTDREMSQLREQVQASLENMPQKDNTVYESFRTKLAESESPEVADFQARLLASYFETQASELGITAADLYEQYRIDIEHQDLSGLQTEELISMVQEGTAPGDSEVFGPSLGEFVESKGDSPATRDEAVKLGYFDDTDPLQVDPEEFDAAMNGATPSYAYGSENTDLLNTRKKIESLLREAKNLGVDVSRGTPAEVVQKLRLNAIGNPEVNEYLPALKTMQAQAAGGAVSRSVQNESGETSPTVSTNPEWLKQKSVKAYNKKYGENISISKSDVNSIIKKLEAGKALTSNQLSKLDYLKDVAAEIQSSDIETVVEDELYSFEKEGFEFIAPVKINVGNMQEGDEVIILSKSGTPDKLTHKGRDPESGDIILEGGQTLYLDDFDTLEIIGQKEGRVFAQSEGDAKSDIIAKAKELSRGYWGKALQGGRYHQPNPKGPRGFISMNRARDYFKVTLTGNANLSTMLHESGHLFLELTNDLASKPDAAPRIVNDMQAIRSWLGVKPGEAFTTEQHEQFARGFEAYLMEGNAPSPELRSAFLRFKSWLVSIYKEMNALNVQLSDEIRAVMGRMVATDEAIRITADSDKLTPIFGDAEQAGMTAEEFSAYRLEFADGMAEAEEAMFEKLLSELAAHTKTKNKKATDQIKAEVEKDVKARPVYQVLHYLKHGSLINGAVAPRALGRLDRAMVERMFPHIKSTRDLRGLTVKEGGVPPMIVAAYFGFKNTDEMIQAIIDAPSMKETIKTEVAERFKAIFGDSMEPQELAKVARKSLHNDRVANMLTRELRVFGKKLGRPIPKGFNSAARIAAEDQINLTEIGRISPYRFQQAEQRFGKQAFEAAAKNDWSAAANAKRLQIMNYWLYRKALAAKDDTNKIRNYLAGFEKIEKRKKLGLAGGQYLESIDTLLEGVQLSSVPAGRLERRKSLETYLNAMEAEGQIVQIPESLRSEIGLKNYKDMTVEQFKALRDAVKNIDHLARLKNKLMLSADKRNFREIMNELTLGIEGRAKKIISMKKQNRTTWEKFQSKMRGFDADLLKIEFLLEQLDGDVVGMSHELIFKPLAEAQLKKYDMLRDINKRLYDPLRKMSKGQKERLAAEYDFLGTSMKGHEVLAVALNMGNKGNLDKLVRGYESRGYTNQGLLNEVDRILTKEDWTMVQHIWDEINTFWPEIAELNKKYTGLEPPKVEPQKVESQHGTFEGGYYPVIYDPNRKHRSFVNSQKGSDLFENNFMRPNVSSGFTEGRTAYAAPILLSLDALPNHLNEVIHYITHYEAVTQANRIINHEDFRQVVSDTVGPEYYNQFKPWLQALAQDGKVDDTATWIDGVARHTTMGVSIMAMGFSSSTAIVQLLGISSSMSRLGPKYLMTGLKGAANKEQRAFALEKSNELRHTMMTFDRDARSAYGEMLAMVSGEVADKLKYRHMQLANFAFYTMGLLQQQVNIATWLGAYNKACAEGRSDAATVADAVVRKTQSGGGAKDLAKIQRHGAIRKLFTAFYTYFSALYGQLRLAGQRMPSEPGVASAQLAALVLLPCLVEKVMRDGLPDDDEPADEWMKSYASGVASFGFATLPLIRDVVSPALSGFGYSSSPASSIVGRGVTSFIQSVKSEEPVSRTQVKNMARLFGLAAHLPATQAIRVWEYFDKLFDGEIEEPVREFLFGVKYKK